jgi:hypothetical protein
MATNVFITPGPELKVKIDRVAAGVAEKPHMAGKLLASARKEEFAFLTEGHEFYPYYLSKLHEFKENPEAAAKLRPAAPGAPGTTAAAPSRPAEPEKKSALQLAMEQAREKAALTADPHPDLYSIPMVGMNTALPALELDMMRAAAAYCAKVGGDFMDLLLVRHANSPGFDFLRKDHPRHQVFQALTSAYTRILEGPDTAALERDCGEGCVEAIRSVCEEKKAFSLAEQARRKAAQLSEPELRQRLTWTEFTVVGRFSLLDLGIRTVAAAAAATRVPPLTATTGAAATTAAAGGSGNAVPIVDDFKAQGRVATSAPMTMRDERTGAMLTAEGASEHLRGQLVAPKFHEDRERAEKRLRGESNLADDDELERNLAARFNRQHRPEGDFNVRPE